ncbi:hypothetical protein ACLKA6_014545 [Drosophila palustris]
MSSTIHQVNSSTVGSGECTANEPKCDHNLESCKTEVRRFYELKDKFFMDCVSKNGNDCDEFADRQAELNSFNKSDSGYRTSLGPNYPKAFANKKF